MGVAFLYLNRCASPAMARGKGKVRVDVDLRPIPYDVSKVHASKTERAIIIAVICVIAVAVAIYIGLKPAKDLVSKVSNPKTCPKDEAGFTCSAHGTCVDGVCKCRTGWTGTNCAEDISQCATGFKVDNDGNTVQPAVKAICSGRGTCYNGTCVCDQGWQGINCGTIFNQCPTAVQEGQALICSGPTQGTCNNATGTCLCEAGFTGAACQFPLSCPRDPDTDTICSGRFCNDPGSPGYDTSAPDYSCICAKDSAGTTDGTALYGVACTATSPSDCPGNGCGGDATKGICDTTSATCKCRPGYTGHGCEEVIPVNTTSGHNPVGGGGWVCSGFSMKAWETAYMSPAGAFAPSVDHTIANAYAHDPASAPGTKDLLEMAKTIYGQTPNAIYAPGHSEGAAAEALVARHGQLGSSSGAMDSPLTCTCNPAYGVEGSANCGGCKSGNPPMAMSPADYAAYYSTSSSGFRESFIGECGPACPGTVTKVVGKTTVTTACYGNGQCVYGGNCQCFDEVPGDLGQAYRDADIKFCFGCKAAVKLTKDWGAQPTVTQPHGDQSFYSPTAPDDHFYGPILCPGYVTDVPEGTFNHGLHNFCYGKGVCSKFSCGVCHCDGGTMANPKGDENVSRYRNDANAHSLLTGNNPYIEGPNAVNADCRWCAPGLTVPWGGRFTNKPAIQTKAVTTMHAPEDDSGRNAPGIADGTREPETRTFASGVFLGDGKEYDVGPCLTCAFQYQPTVNNAATWGPSDDWKYTEVTWGPACKDICTIQNTASPGCLTGGSCNYPPSWFANVDPSKPSVIPGASVKMHSTVDSNGRKSSPFAVDLRMPINSCHGFQCGIAAFWIPPLGADTGLTNYTQEELTAARSGTNADSALPSTGTSIPSFFPCSCPYDYYDTTSATKGNPFCIPQKGNCCVSSVVNPLTGGPSHCGAFGSENVAKVHHGSTPGTPGVSYAGADHKPFKGVTVRGGQVPPGVNEWGCTGYGKDGVTAECSMSDAEKRKGDFTFRCKCAPGYDYSNPEIADTCSSTGSNALCQGPPQGASKYYEIQSSGPGGNSDANAPGAWVQQGIHSTDPKRATVQADEDNAYIYSAYATGCCFSTPRPNSSVCGLTDGCGIPWYSLDGHSSATDWCTHGRAPWKPTSAAGAIIGGGLAKITGGLGCHIHDNAHCVQTTKSNEPWVRTNWTCEAEKPGCAWAHGGISQCAVVGPVHFGCPTSCFRDYTEVLLADGTWTPITKVQSGMEVESGYGVPCTVLFVEEQFGGRKMWGFNGGPLFATVDHPFMEAKKRIRMLRDPNTAWSKAKAYTNVGAIEVGTLLLSRDGPVEVAEIKEETIPLETKVYDLVTSTQTYVVRASAESPPMVVFDDMPELNRSPSVVLGVRDLFYWLHSVWSEMEILAKRGSVRRRAWRYALSHKVMDTIRPVLTQVPEPVRDLAKNKDFAENRAKEGIASFFEASQSDSLYMELANTVWIKTAEALMEALEPLSFAQGKAVRSRCLGALNDAKEDFISLPESVVDAWEEATRATLL